MNRPFSFSPRPFDTTKSALLERRVLFLTAEQIAFHVTGHPYGEEPDSKTRAELRLIGKKCVRHLVDKKKLVEVKVPFPHQAGTVPEPLVSILQGSAPQDWHSANSSMRDVMDQSEEDVKRTWLSDETINAMIEGIETLRADLDLDYALVIQAVRSYTGVYVRDGVYRTAHDHYIRGSNTTTDCYMLPENAEWFEPLPLQTERRKDPAPLTLSLIINTDLRRMFPSPLLPGETAKGSLFYSDEELPERVLDSKLLFNLIYSRWKGHAAAGDFFLSMIAEESSRVGSWEMSRAIGRYDAPPPSVDSLFDPPTREVRVGDDFYYRDDDGLHLFNSMNHDMNVIRAACREWTRVNLY